jgi:Ribosomal protein S4 and related proteins
MSRYLGPVWKKSRRLGFSILETGKELQRRPFAPANMANVAANLASMEFSYMKNKNYALCTELVKSNFVKSLMKPFVNQDVLATTSCIY